MENNACGLRVPELLAPAGSIEALYAAVAAGADAVYTGLGAFNARAAARDIALEDFARACRLAHAHGARVYVAENVYLREGELGSALALAYRAHEAGADALIVADAGFARLVRRELPGLELHLSTQAGVMSVAGVRLAARELGVERVTCARELSSGEIAELCRTGTDIEVFCHGAICICYSGACAFSALRRGRSANRGDCTQPCRLSYGLEDGAGRSVAGVSGDRLLCPRDYLSIGHLEELCRAGVSALKIEGRMKNPDYVYNVVRTYRAALDALATGAEIDPAALTAQLGRSFNRGFTDAYLRGTSGAELMSFERAINQGIRVGEVVERGHREVVVALEGAVAAGDTLEIRTILPEDAAPDVPARWPLVPCEVDGAAGDRIRVRCKRRAAPGSPVYLTASAGVRSEAEEAVAAMHAEAFELAPAEAVAEFADRGDWVAGEKPRCPAGGAADAASHAPAVAVVANSPQLAQRLVGDGRQPGVYVRASRVMEDPAWDDMLGGVAVILDEPSRAAGEARVRDLCRRASRVVCRNLGAIELARAEGAAFEVAAPVSATNSETVDWLVSLGAQRVWLPDELPIERACAIAHGAARRVCGLLVYGVPQLMVCEHCLLTAEGPCDGDHDRCARRRSERYLVEEGGTRLPVHVDRLGRTRIYDAAPLDRLDALGDVAAAGFGAVLVDADLVGEQAAIDIVEQTLSTLR